jgi:hypothetical protein
VEKRFAKRKGGSNVVLAVMPKERRFVTAAIAEIGYITCISFVVIMMGVKDLQLWGLSSAIEQLYEYSCQCCLHMYRIRRKCLRGTVH